MVTISKTGGPGLRFENEVVRLEVNYAGGVSKGWALEIELSDGEYKKVSRAGGTSDVSTSASVILGIAMEDGVNGQKIRVGVRGVFMCRTSSFVNASKMVRASDTYTYLGSFPTNPVATGATEYIKACGIALEGGDGTALTKVLFDGITGFACTAGTS